MSPTIPVFPIPKVSGTPIAVYQMGKVGSRTIVTSLEKLHSADSVHHLHLLSTGGIRACRTESKQLAHSRAIRSYLDSGPQRPINVITAVREPIAQQLSELFQTLAKRQPQLIDAAGIWKESAICDFFQEQIASFEPAKDRINKWFKNEFRQALGINIFDHVFDHQCGHITIENGNIRVLVLRLENSDQWPTAISEFLQLDDRLELERTNSANQKPYEMTYRNVKKKLELPIDSLERIYSTDYCRHFYTSELITEFMGKWSRPLAQVADSAIV